MSPKNEPTVLGVDDFNADEDAAALRGAMKGLGTDEEAIIEVLTSRSNQQRLAIADAYQREYDRDIIEDLKSELGGNFEDVIVALMRSPEEYLCKELHHAMSGMGTNEDTLVEILCTRPKNEIAQLVAAYESMYERPLAEHMCSETSGDFRRLLTLIVTGARDDDEGVDVDRAHQSAQELFEAGEGRFGTDEAAFNKILAHESFSQLRQIFEEYKTISGCTIEQAIKAEIGGELADAISAIVECVQDISRWYATRLRKAMHGIGTDDRTLIRIIVSRSEIDLGDIKAQYEALYNKTLESEVRGETSGDYKRALVALIGPA